MTQESIISNHVDDVSPSGSAYSSGEIYRMTLEENGDLFMENNGDLRGIANGDVLDRVDSGSLIINSPGTHLGTKVMIKVDGPTTFVTGGNKCLENGEFANEKCHEETKKEVQEPSGVTKIRRCEICGVLAIIIFVVSIIISAVIYFKIVEPRNIHTTTITTNEPSVTYSSTNNYEGYMVPREVWGAVNPASPLVSMMVPATLVVIKHTGGSTCSIQSYCRNRVREIQKQHMETYNLPDIAYNFLIAGDGKIYVGRGFGVKNTGRNDSLDIAFIGNFTEVSPTNIMVAMGARLINDAIDNNAIDYSAYHVVNHNQTEPTDSPGENLFKLMSRPPSSYTYYSSVVCYHEVEGAVTTNTQCP